MKRPASRWPFYLVTFFAKAVLARRDRWGRARRLGASPVRCEWGTDSRSRSFIVALHWPAHSPATSCNRPAPRHLAQATSNWNGGDNIGVTGRPRWNPQRGNVRRHGDRPLDASSRRPGSRRASSPLLYELRDPAPGPIPICAWHHGSGRVSRGRLSSSWNDSTGRKGRSLCGPSTMFHCSSASKPRRFSPNSSRSRSM